MHMRVFARVVVVGLVALALGASAAVAQERTINIGGRFGYSHDAEEVVGSASLLVPMTTRVDFYPSVDIYAPERGSKIGFNGDVRIRFPKVGDFLYGGFGGGVISTTQGDSSHTEFGANLLLGAELHFGWFRPFVEGRAVRREQTQFQVFGGFNISRSP
jgi:hypothetical protein